MNSNLSPHRAVQCPREGGALFCAHDALVHEASTKYASIPCYSCPLADVGLGPDRMAHCLQLVGPAASRHLVFGTQERLDRFIQYTKRTVLPGGSPLVLSGLALETVRTFVRNHFEPAYPWPPA